jgi:hypothetical protein
MQKKYLYPIFFILLLSCKKNDNNCPETVIGSFSVDKPVIYEGSDIKMTPAISGIYTYKWSGPGGWTSDQNIPVKTNMQAANSGTYMVEVINFQNCVEFRGTKNLQVVPIPNAPCNINANTIQGTVPGFNNFSFSFSSWHAFNSTFYVTVITASNDRLDISFPGSNPPSPGVYKARETYPLPAPPDLVNIVIRQGAIQYRTKDVGDVIVKLVGGRLEISFCDQTMFNFDTPSLQYTISGKIIQ